MKCTIVFPNNLFLNRDLLDKDTKVFIFQDPLFFRDIKYPVKFNKKKILMHLLSTEKYHNDLLKSGYDSELIPFFDLQSQNYFEDFLISDWIKDAETVIKNLTKGPQVLVGSSMGGYFAYIIGSTLKIKTCLFNPAVHGRSIEPEVPEMRLKGNENWVFLGDRDNVITGSGVRDYFKKEGVGKFNYNGYKGGHRVPYPVFTNCISKAAGLQENRILLFEEFKNLEDDISSPTSI